MHPAFAAKLEGVMHTAVCMGSVELRFTAASPFIAQAAGQLTTRHYFSNFRVNAPLVNASKGGCRSMWDLAQR